MKAPDYLTGIITTVITITITELVASRSIYLPGIDISNGTYAAN